jgi:hypothetical protein
MIDLPKICLSLICAIVGITGVTVAEEASTTTTATTAKQSPAFTPFTGKVLKDKVRLRTQPTLDDNVFREAHRDDMLVVIGEIDGFYVTQPPKDLKAYVFRTFILNNVVEGSHVNVRIKPDLDAPIIAQLNPGDHIESTVSAANSKWLEIPMPDSAHFYIAKEFVKKVGDADMLDKVTKRRAEIVTLLDSANADAQVELKKPFDLINISGPTATLQKVIAQYADFPAEVDKAKGMLAQLQESYLQKKIDHLDFCSKQASEAWEGKLKELEMLQQRFAQLEQEFHQEKNLHASKEEEGLERERQAALLIQKTTLEAAQQVQKAALEAAEQVQATALEAARVAREAALKEAYDAQAAAVTNKLAIWAKVEEAIYENWKDENKSDVPLQAYYSQQLEEAVTLRGVIEPYNQPVRNRPGDYRLLNQADNTPIAFLYSTSINLQDNIGQVVTVKAVTRPNNHFAFPAYYALAVE